MMESSAGEGGVLAVATTTVASAGQQDSAPAEIAKKSKKKSNAKQRLLGAAAVCAVFMLIEVTAGLYAGSLAVLTDAAHMLSDLSSFLISFLAMEMASRPGTPMLSFGYQRAEILGALMSIVLIWILTICLLYSAVQRIIYPQPVQGNIMVYTALFGIASNIGMALLLSDGHHHHHHGHGHSHGHAHGRTCPTEAPANTASHNEHSHLQKSPSHTQLLSSSDAGCLNQGLLGSDAPSDPGSATPPPAAHGTAVQNYRACGDMLKRFSLSTHEALPRDVLGSGADVYISVEEEQSVDGKRYAAMYTHDDQAGATDCMSKNVNIAAAYLHALGDLVQNIGVLIAGGLIWAKPAWVVADPVCTILFGFIVFYTTLGLLKDTTNVLMEGAPAGVNTQELTRELATIPGVASVHDVHVWSLSIGHPSLSCHLVVENSKLINRVLAQATALTQVKYGVLHTTIQIDGSENKAACETDHHEKCHAESSSSS